MAGFCAGFPCGVCSGFFGVFFLFVAVFFWALSSFAKLGIVAAQSEIDDLRTAEDTSCTFSSLPGIAVVHDIKFKTGTKKRSARVNAWSIECRAKVVYGSTTWHSGGVKEVDVFAGLEFQYPDDRASSCSSALGGDWQNAKVVNGNGAKQTNFNGVPIPIDTDYRCGNFGWVGCRGTSCTHHFSKFNGLGFDEMEKRGLNFLDPLSAEPEHKGSLPVNSGECPGLHDNAQIACSIDASDQLHLGSSQDLLDKARSAKADAQDRLESMMHYCHGCLLISFCLFALAVGVFFFNRRAFGREKGVRQLAQSLL